MCLEFVDARMLDWRRFIDADAWMLDIWCFTHGGARVAGEMA
jgi:hypothetical protein